MFIKHVIVLIIIIQVKKAASESTNAPASSTINSSTAEETKIVEHEGIDLLPDKTSCGTSSAFDQFPWMGLIEREDADGERTFYCGGCLINERYVLTAAACITIARVDGKLRSLRVRLGEYNVDTDPDCIKSKSGEQCAPPPLDIEVDEQIDHEGDVSKNYYHDIGLLRLKKKVPYTENIRPICLPTTSEEHSRTYVNKRLTVAGWGRTETGLFSSIKLKLQVPVTDSELCRSRYKELDVYLGNGQFCAGGERGRDTCKGDRGNALMAANVDESAKVHWYAVGVVSFGPRKCGTKDWPSVYTNISAYMPWILSNLKA